MANPANLTVTLLNANGETAHPAVQLLDTAGDISIVGINSETHNLMIEATNGSGANSATLTLNAGVQPPAMRPRPLVVTLGTSATKLIGPFEAARFVQADGTIKLTLAGTSPDVELRIFRLPKFV